jgi:putative oxidoreductase
MSHTTSNIAAIHLRNGLDQRKHGFEFELMILAGVVAVGLSGPGDWSLDEALSVPSRSWAGLAAIALGVASGLVIAATRQRQGQPQGQREELKQPG